MTTTSSRLNSLCAEGANTLAGKRMRRFNPFVTAVASILVGVVACGGPPNDTVDPWATPLLDVSAGKHRAGIIVTNREDTDMLKCSITVYESGRDDGWWTVFGTIKPMQSVDVLWPDFRSFNGAHMPAYIGQSAKRFKVSCTGGDGRLREAYLQIER